MSKPRTVKVGVVGLGFGAEVHVPGYAMLPGVEVIALVGRSEDRARARAAGLGVPRGLASLGDLLDLGPDVVSLAVPPPDVAPALELCLARKVHLLCEKPLGTDLAQARSIASAARDRVTAIDFQFGELATFTRLGEIIASGVMGRVRHADVSWLTESWAAKSQTWSWKTEAGGGVLPLLASHLFYLSERLFGRPERIWAAASRSSSEVFAPAGALAGEDLVHYRAEHAGMVFAATIGNANPGSTLHRWTVVFDKGTVTLENLGRDYASGFVLSVCGGPLDGDVVREPVLAGDGRIRPFIALAGRFIAAVRGEGAMRPNFDDGVRAMEIEQAARQSIRYKATIALPLP